MSQLEIAPHNFQYKKDRGLTAFETFCSGLERPMITEHNYIIAFVSLICYRREGLQRLTGQVMMISHGHGFGNIRISDGEQQLLDEDIYNLLESRSRVYYLGRSGRELVIEDFLSGTNRIHRIDMLENLKRDRIHQA